MAEPAPVPPDDVRQAAREILSRAEFRRPSRSVMEVALDWIGRQLARLLDGISGGGSVVGYLIAAAAVASIAVLVVRFARNVQRDPGTGAPPSDVGRPPTDWTAEAEAHEAAGEWREGLRCRYRAMVADLAGRGLIDEVPGRTAGEYRAAVGAAVPQAAPDFSGATDLFERAWYGGAPTGPDESADFRRLSERVLVGAGR